MPNHSEDPRIDLPSDFDAIPAPRRVVLDRWSDRIVDAIQDSGTARLLFVCTHNSRRSQFAQIWAAFIGHRLGLPIEAFSAGTEVTSVAAGVRTAMASEGMSVEATVAGTNPVVDFSVHDEGFGVRCVSKRLDDPTIPGADAIAVMVCDDADRACPTLPNARARIGLPFRDPKRADGTAEAAAIYRASSREIALAIHYAFAQVAGR